MNKVPSKEFYKMVLNMLTDTEADMLSDICETRNQALGEYVRHLILKDIQANWRPNKHRERRKALFGLLTEGKYI